MQKENNSDVVHVFSSPDIVRLRDRSDFGLTSSIGDADHHSSAEMDDINCQHQSLPLIILQYLQSETMLRIVALSLILLSWGFVEALIVDRRSYMAQLLLPSLLQTLNLPSSNLLLSSSTTTSSDTVAEVTDKVFFDLRIARQDGSSYVRDDLPDTFENRVIQARLTMGLFGKQAPK